MYTVNSNTSSRFGFYSFFLIELYGGRGEQDMEGERGGGISNVNIHGTGIRIGIGMNKYNVIRKNKGHD